MKFILTLLFLSFIFQIVSATSLQWKMSRYTKIIRQNDKSFLQISVPEKAPDIAKANCAIAQLDLKDNPLGELDISIRLEVESLSKPRNHFHGAELKVFLETADGKQLSLGTSVPGSKKTDKILRVRRLIPAGIQHGWIRLGLNDSFGTVKYDLSSLKIRFLPLNRKKATLSEKQEKDFKLIENRVRNRILQKKVRDKDIEKILNESLPDGTFSGVDYKNVNRSAWKAAGHLYYVELLCRGWNSKQSAYYRSEKLKIIIQKSAEWWCKKQPRSSNFWWNDMEIPRLATRILFIAPELFPENSHLYTGLLQICHNAVLNDHYTYANKVFIAENIFLRSIVEKDFDRMIEVADIIKSEIKESNYPEKARSDWHFGGIRPDRSFQFHGPQLQFGNYGLQFLEKITYWGTILRGTQLEFNLDQIKLMRELAVDGYGWCLWNGSMDLLAVGRQLGLNSGRSNGLRARNAIVNLRTLDSAKNAYDNVLAGKIVGAKYFFNSAYLVYRRPDWFISLRMNSKRVRPVEDDVNGDNALGRYFSDGTIQLLRTGKEYENITGCWDWTRLPGTTLPATPVLGPEECKKRGLKVYNYSQRLRYSFGLPARMRGETDFVEGTVNDHQAVAVYTQKLDGVSAKKAYFFDEKAVYLLGCSINSTSPYSVATTVNVCRRNGLIEKGDSWVWHDGIGYKGESLRVSTGIRTGDWGVVSGGITSPAPFSAELFAIGIEHGIRPENASYKVVILPGATPEQTKDFQPKILLNNNEIQAVKFSDGNIGAVFHTSGKLGNFKTKKPGVFILSSNETF